MKIAAIGADLSKESPCQYEISLKDWRISNMT